MKPAIPCCVHKHPVGSCLSRPTYGHGMDPSLRFGISEEGRSPDPDHPIPVRVVQKQLFWENLHLSPLSPAALERFHANCTTAPGTCLPSYRLGPVPHGSGHGGRKGAR